jgi:hypothetical protein
MSCPPTQLSIEPFAQSICGWKQQHRVMLCFCCTQLLLMTTLSYAQDLHSCGGLKAHAIAEGMTRHGDPVACSYGSDSFFMVVRRAFACSGMTGGCNDLIFLEMFYTIQQSFKICSYLSEKPCNSSNLFRSRKLYPISSGRSY